MNRPESTDNKSTDRFRWRWVQVQATAPSWLWDMDKGLRDSTMPSSSGALRGEIPCGFWRAALDSLSAHIAILDESGRILAVNAAWKRCASRNGQTDPDACIGTNYLDVCSRALGEDGEEAAAAFAGIRSVLDGHSQEFSLSYPCHSPSRKCWFMLRATRFDGPGPARAVIAHENVTAPKEAEIRAQEAAAELHQANSILLRQADELLRAEAFEADRSRILELVARNEQLNTILHEAVLLADRQNPAARCAIVLLRRGQTEITTAPNYPAGLLQELDALARRTFANLGSDVSLVALAQAVNCAQVSGNPHPFRFVSIRTRPDHLAGVLAIARPDGEATPETPAMLERAAALAGIAIDHARLYERLSFQARHDALTELPNRSLFQERLQQAIVRSRLEGSGFAVMRLDLDRFRQVNEFYGQRAGDLVLREAGYRIAGCARPEDTVARLGEDEFAVIIENLKHPRDAERVTNCVMSALEAPFWVLEQSLSVTCSAGISFFPQDGGDAGTLLRNAGQALDESPIRGRNICYRYEPNMSVLASQRTEIECHLRQALQNGELELHYQPQLDMRRQIVAVEALLRWHSPALGAVSPAVFIPVAEASGLIVDIGTWVLRQACMQAVAWQGAGLAAGRMAVNVSACQLTRPDFASSVAAILRESGLQPELLEIEVTESAMLQDAEVAVRELMELRRLGVRVSLDDFGTGYSSLSYIQDLPLDAIKIDRSFIDALNGDSQQAVAVVRAILTMARSLNLDVVAEGIERETQFATLDALGCGVVQGFLLHRPLDVEALESILQRERAQRELYVDLRAAESGPNADRAPGGTRGSTGSSKLEIEA
jgi:diguanylate cyclase (GGDEF)-like protein